MSMDYGTKFECNACPETEGGYAPCVFFGLLKPEVCPISGDETEWEKSKRKSDKQLQAELDSLKSQKGMADMGFMPEGEFKKAFDRYQGFTHHFLRYLQRIGEVTDTSDTVEDLQDKLDTKIEQLEAKNNRLYGVIGEISGERDKFKSKINVMVESLELMEANYKAFVDMAKALKR